jgi:hypothetical protein
MKKVLLCLTILLFSTIGFAQMQPGTVTQNLIDVSTASPDVASLGKFGNVPVSYSTGVPNISIPLYQIDIAGIKMPLSLSYHAGGIKVAETASSTGLGWALSGLGMVSRSMVGRPDEDESCGLFKMPLPDSVFKLPVLFPTYLFNVERGLADNEPDDFSYSTIDGGGNFTFQRDKSILQTPFSNNKIEFKSVPFLGNIFQITDEKGVLYIYGMKVDGSMSLTGTSGNYTGAWRLTKIVDVNSTDTIFISYETACNPIYVKNWNYSHFLGQDKQCNVNTTESFLSEARNSYQSSVIDEAYPKEIRWRGGKIVFTNVCDRTDVSGSAMRLREVNVYANQEGTLKLVNRVVLYHSYFMSDSSVYAFTNATADQKRRLRLDSVGIMPVTGSLPPSMYRMVYDTTMMAPRESASQDRWGFNNGAFTNNTLMPAQSILWESQYRAVGSANRQTDSVYMKACTIKSIEYPTRGKSVFDFAPHAFWISEMQKEQHTISLSCQAGFQSTDTAYFTVASNDLSFKYRFDLPPLTTGVIDYPRIVIRDLTLGTDTYASATPVNQTTGRYVLSDVELKFIAGHSYSFIMNTYSPSATVSAFATIDWTRNLGTAMVRKIGGGLRVNTISDYDEFGKLVKRETYDYQGGTMLTDMYFQDMNVEQVIPRAAQGEPLTCVYQTQMYPPGFSLIFHANSILPASQCNGSPLLYTKVTKAEVDSAGNANGKTEYGYQITIDESAALQDLSTMGTLTWNRKRPVVRSYTYKNNFVAYENTYKSTAAGYQKILSKHYDYRTRDTTMAGVKINSKYLTVCCLTNNMSDGYAQNDFNITRVDLPTGVMLKCRETDTTWDDWGNKMYKAKEFEYNDSTNINPTLVRSFNSEGDTITVLNKYARDLSSAGNVYEKMKNRNMVGIPVQIIATKNGKPLSQQNINWIDFFGNGKLLVPSYTEEKRLNYPLETSVRFVSFDTYGNIMQQKHDSGMNMSYVWAYDTAFAIATVKNAALNEVAYTSFEPDASGYWTIGSAVRDLTQGIMGRQSYALSNGSVSKSGLTTAKSYVVSYWSKGASASVNGVAATSYYNKNGWYYYEHKVNSGAATVTVSGSVTIDELRLYPSDAQMTTVAYDPLTGITGTSDVNNRMQYFEYDGFNRLKLIRDEDRNVIRTIDYKVKL